MNNDEKDSKGSTEHLEVSQQVPSLGHDGKTQAALDADTLFLAESTETMGKFGIVLCMIAGVSGLLFGFDTGVISAALVNIGTDVGHLLTDVEKEWVASATGVGALIGALMGNLADVIGRKWTLAIGDVWFVVGAVLIASSYSLEQLIVGRLVLGFGVGIAAAITPLYISELSPTRLRGRLMCIQAVMITGGQVVAYAFGAALANVAGGWRILFAISLVPAIGQAAFIHYMPESPRYDLMKGETGKTRKTFKIVYAGASDDLIELKIAALREVVNVSNEFQQRYNLLGRLKLVCTKARYARPTFTACGLIFFQQFCGFNTLLYYSSTIFEYAGFSNATATSLIVACTNLACTFVCMALLGRVGKRTILLCGQPGMIAGLALAAMAFHFMTEKTNGVLVPGTQYDTKWTNMMLGMMVFFIASYATGLGTIPWQSNEFFPLEMRGLGASLLAATCWSANIVVSATFLTLMNRIGAAGAFGFYAGLSFIGLIFLIFCYPEPDGLSLEEVDTLFENGFGIRKSKELRMEKKARLLSAA